MKENQLRQYLLGQLDEADEEQVELRLLAEPDYAEEFDIVVNELIDRYLSGEFEGEELKRVKKYFFRATERVEKLRFAVALKEGKSRGVSIARPKRSSFTSYLAIAAAVIAIISVGFGVWRLFFYQPDLRKGLAALHAAFSEQRPLEARLSDFNYAPLSKVRGAPAKVDYLQRDLAASLLLKEVSERPTAASHHALGQFYLAERQFDKAIDQFKAALALDPRNSRVHSDLGAALLEEGKLQGSGPEKSKELETFARSLEHLTKALELDSSLLEAHFNRALVSQYMMPSQQAEAAWREYLQRDANSPWADEARRNLKLVEENRQKTSLNQDQELRDFLKARHAGDDNAAWQLITQHYTSAGNDIANRLIDSILEPESPANGIEPGGALPALSYLADLELKRAGDRYSSELVAQYEHTTARQRVLLADGRRHMKAGYILFTQSRFAEAIGEYSEAKLQYERAGDKVDNAFVDYRLAHCYVFVPDLERAKLSFTRLSSSCKKAEYRWLLAHSLYGLAHVSADSSEFTKALDQSELALAAFELVGDINGILRCVNQLSSMHQSLNRAERSLDYLRIGLTLVASNPVEPMQKWQVFIGLAESLGSMKLLTAALFYQKEALSVAIDMDRPLIVSRSYAYVGAAYSELKKYDEALSHVTQAIETGRSVPEGEGSEIMANASQQLGDVFRQAGQCDKALEAYDWSIRLYDALNFDYYSYMAHKGKLICFLAQSDDRHAGEELQTVLHLIELYRSKITSESQRNSFFHIEQSVLDLAIHYESSLTGNSAKAFGYSEAGRGRSLLDAMSRSAHVLKKPYGPDVALPAVVNSMTLAEIQMGMPEESQILQYAVLEDRVLIWLVTKSDFHLEAVNIGTELLAEKVGAFKATINRPPASNVPMQDGPASDLYQILVAPVEPFLDKAKFLCVVPDKMLNYLPFGALVSPETSRFVLEDYDMGVAPSSTVFVNLSASARKKAGKFAEKLLSVGDPSFNRTTFDSLPELPSAGREAHAVALFYPAHSVLVGSDARERKLRSEIEKADVAHLAMHYVVDPASEMLSGFPLSAEPATIATKQETSDGFLQFYEIYSLKLPRTRLIVLSACQTGIEQQYSGEGAIGVARPFLVMGVPVVVASLWPVDSDASAQLMTRFHEHRIRDELPVTQALRRAQIEMAYGPDLRYRHPYYWAPFLAVGGHSSY